MKQQGFSQIRTNSAPQPVARYSQAIRVPASRSGDLILVAGQVGVTPEGHSVGDDVATQTRAALNNLQAVLEAAGSGMHSVVRMDCYLTRTEDWSGFNTVYEEVFGELETPPARTTVFVGLSPGLLVEVTAIAVADGDGT